VTGTSFKPSVPVFGVLPGRQQNLLRINREGLIGHAVRHTLLGSRTLDGGHVGVHHEPDTLSLKNLYESLRQGRFGPYADPRTALQHRDA
jgi:hypothetical protein